MQPTRKRVIETLLDNQDRLAEFLLEGEEDFISKEEAIRRAENDEIEAVVVRSARHGVYLRAIADKNRPNNFHNLATKRRCGPEIGPQLRAVLRALVSTFHNKMSVQQRKDCCNGLTDLSLGQGAWDIDSLSTNARDGSTPGYNPFIFQFQQQGCAKLRPCDQTVMVSGQCHKAWAVNYITFGTMFGLCQKGWPKQLAKHDY